MELWKEEFTFQSAFSYSAFLLKEVIFAMSWSSDFIIKPIKHHKVIMVTLHKLWMGEAFWVKSSQHGSGALSISEDAAGVLMDKRGSNWIF